MLGKRSPQGRLFTVENRLRKKVSEESFYVFLADHRHELFRDEDFAMLYCLNNGRESVPPSLLATALILQTFDRVSDQEAADRAQFDQRWQVALGLSDEEGPFVKSTLCLFRNQLILHKEAKLIFQKGIEYLRKQGFVKRHKIRLALDTTPIFGKGAVEDTFNMLAEGLRQVLRVLALLGSQEPEEFARLHDFGRYTQPSFKGAWSINWDNEKERQTVLDSLVADCGRILSMASSALNEHPAESQQYNQILEASELLSKLLAQDVRRTDSGKVEIIDGVAKDRIVSVHEHEVLLQQAKAYQRTDEYRTIYRQRVVAEHRIARLIRLGVRKARYFGSTKVLFQLAMAAAVANLTLFVGSHVSGAFFVLSLLLLSTITIIDVTRMTYRRLVAA